MEHSHWVNSQQWMRKWNILFFITCICFCVSSVVCIGTNGDHVFSGLNHCVCQKLKLFPCKNSMLFEPLSCFQSAQMSSGNLPFCVCRSSVLNGWNIRPICMNIEGLVSVIARHQEDKMTTYPVQLKKLILGKVKLGKSDYGLDSVEWEDQSVSWEGLSKIMSYMVVDQS